MRDNNFMIIRTFVQKAPSVDLWRSNGLVGEKSALLCSDLTLLSVLVRIRNNSSAALQIVSSCALNRIQIISSDQLEEVLKAITIWRSVWNRKRN